LTGTIYDIVLKSARLRNWQSWTLTILSGALSTLFACGIIYAGSFTFLSARMITLFSPVIGAIVLVIGLWAWAPWTVADEGGFFESLFSVFDNDHRDGSLSLKLLRAMVLCAALLMCYFGSQLFAFGFLSYAIGSYLWQTIFALCYPWVMFLLRYPIITLAHSLDQHRGRNEMYLTLRITPYMFWFTQLLQTTFKRFLFLRVDHIYILLVFQFILLISDTIRFPLRMSKWWMRTFGISISGNDDEARKHRVRLCEELYWVSLARMLSLIGVVLIFATSRNLWNANFSILSARDVSSELPLYLLIMFITEAVIAIVLMVVIWRVFHMDVLGCGVAPTLDSDFARKLVIALAIHALQDGTLAFNRFVFFTR
jgi:hypothetical protein